MGHSPPPLVGGFLHIRNLLRGGASIVASSASSSRSSNANTRRTYRLASVPSATFLRQPISAPPTRKYPPFTSMPLGSNCFFRCGKTIVLRSSPTTKDNRTTPLYVSFSDNELIGDAAMNQVAMNPVNTYAISSFSIFFTTSLVIALSSVFDAKRLIGRKYDGIEVQSDIKHFLFKVLNKAGKPYVCVRYRGEDKEFVRRVPVEAIHLALIRIFSPLKRFLRWKETAEAYLAPTPSSPCLPILTTRNGCWDHRRSQCPSNYQRTYRCRYRLWPRQESQWGT